MKKLNEPLKSLLWNNDSSDTLIIVGGSDDDRFTFKSLAKKLLKNGESSNIITFSFKGTEENISLPLKQQIEDLKTILKWVLKRYQGNITIICTSMGAYSTSHVLVESEFNKRLNSAIFIDPADYYLSKDMKSDGGGTWNGLNKYQPKEITASSLLNNLDSKTKIHVINFTLRNYTKNGYVKKDIRHIDNKAYYQRLNNNMVKSFYNNTPKNNRGEYIEDNTIPHAFNRDGNIENNVISLTKLIQKILK